MNVRHRAFAGVVMLLGSISWLSLQAQPPNRPLPQELRLIPSDAGLFVSVRVADIWKNDITRPLRDLIAKEEPKALEMLEGKTGLRPEQIERISVFMPTLSDDSVTPLIVVTTTEPYNREKVFTALRAESPQQQRRRDRFGDPPPFKDVPKAVPPFPELKKTYEPSPPPPLEFKKEDCAVADEDAPDRPKLDLDAPLYILDGMDGAFLIPINDNTFVIVVLADSEEEDMIALIAQLLRRKPIGELTDAINAAAGEHHVVVGVNPGNLLKQMTLPDDPTVLPFRSLLQLRSATMTLDAGPTVKIGGELRFPNAAGATKAMRTIDALRTLAGEMMPGIRKELSREPDSVSLLKLLDELERVMDEAKLSADGDRVIVRGEMKADVPIVLLVNELAKKVGDNARQSQLVNNLKQIGIGWHSYHDAMGFLPTTRGANAPYPVSWRVLILPYLEQDALYRQYRFDEPWDSENNKKLIPLMPKLYEIPNHPAKEKGQTYLRTFIGTDTILEPNANLKSGYNPVRLTDITDGLSNTIMVIEAAEAEVWTKPEGLAFSPRLPLPKLGGHPGNRAVVLMCDGAVRTIDLSKIRDASLRGSITRNGGEVVNLDD